LIEQTGYQVEQLTEDEVDRQDWEQEKVSRAIFREIKQNYFWAWFYNGIAIPTAFFGLIHPIIGAIAMFTSSINVVLNSTLSEKPI